MSKEKENHCCRCGVGLEMERWVAAPSPYLDPDRPTREYACCPKCLALLKKMDKAADPEIVRLKKAIIAFDQSNKERFQKWLKGK